MGIVQFREKDLDTGELCERGLAFRQRTRRCGVRFSSWTTASTWPSLSAPTAVHLGQEDLPFEAARRVAPGLIVGASTHNPEEACAAQAAGASLRQHRAGVSHGHEGPGHRQRRHGHDRTRHARTRNTFHGDGGELLLENVGQVVERGARHVAVVTAVTAAEDPQSAAAALRQAIRG